MGIVADRRAETLRRIEEIQSHLGGAEKLASGKACVYTTGSFGRLEASPYSDLDVFIVARSGGGNESLLNGLDGICSKADLVNVTRQLNIPDFSGEGRYLVQYAVHDFVRTLGKPEDDSLNTFTARLLMLLESRPLVEPGVYRQIVEEIVGAYWRDFVDHRDRFIPAFLANDILRLWRTFCVNYEANTEREPDEKRAKRKLKNYKLKHSRLLTCFSAVLYLLAIHQEKSTVDPSDALQMIAMTPTERLEWLLESPPGASVKPGILRLLKLYGNFLAETNRPERDLIPKFLDKQTSRQLSESANQFGDEMFAVLNSIGRNGRFHRLLVV